MHFSVPSPSPCPRNPLCGGRKEVALAEELYRRYPPDPDSSRGMMKVLRTGEPELGARIPDSVLEQAARDEEHLQILRELKLKSYLCVPLKAKQRTLGVMTSGTSSTTLRSTWSEAAKSH